MTTGLDRYAVACCQTDFDSPRSRDGIAAHVDRMLAMVEMAVTGYRPFFAVKLVVFPEFAHVAPVYLTAREILDHLAVPIPNEHTERYQACARQHDVYIQTGTFLERDDRWPGAVFNTTCLIGPEGIVTRYRKVHPWVPWEVHASPHDIPDYPDDPFPVASTPLGELGVAICYDWIFPEVIRELALRGAEVLIRVSAYMDPWGATAPMDWWTVVNRCRALENLSYVVATNQGARLEHYPPFSWPGGSMIVDYDGRILSQADPGPGEKIVVAEIDLGALRAARRERLGHNPLAHLRPTFYGTNRPAARAVGYPGGSFVGTDAADGDRSVEDNEKVIRESIQRSYQQGCQQDQDEE